MSEINHKATAGYAKPFVRPMDKDRKFGEWRSGRHAANPAEAQALVAEIDQLKALLADSVPFSTFNALAEEKGADVRMYAAFYKDAKELLAAEKERADAAEARLAAERKCSDEELDEARAERDAEKARAAEMEAQANAEKARADAAERMVCELRAAAEAVQMAYIDCARAPNTPLGVLDAALSRTEAVAGRWVSRSLYESRQKLWEERRDTVLANAEAIRDEERDARHAAWVAKDEARLARAERDAAIAARDEAVAKLDAIRMSHDRVTDALAAAERARDEVGIQLAAAQARIEQLEAATIMIGEDGTPDRAMGAWARMDPVVK